MKIDWRLTKQGAQDHIRRLAPSVYETILEHAKKPGAWGFSEIGELTAPPGVLPFEKGMLCAYAANLRPGAVAAPDDLVWGAFLVIDYSTQEEAMAEVDKFMEACVEASRKTLSTFSGVEFNLREESQTLQE